MRLARVPCAFLLAAHLWLPPITARSQTPTFDQVLSRPRLGAPKLSPNGKLIAYLRTSPDWKENAFRGELWLTDLATGTRLQLTRSRDVKEVDWSPDSQRIAFTSGKDNQLYLLDVRGGEAAKVSDVKGGVQSIAWSPDGRKIAFTTGVEDADKKKRAEELGSFTVIESDEARTRLATVEVPEGLPEATAAATILTDKDAFSVEGFRWSPDSTAIAIESVPADNLRHILSRKISTIRLSDRKLTTVAGPGMVSSPLWSPDGKALAYLYTDKPETAFYANQLIVTVPVDGGKPTPVSQSFDEIPSPLEWTPRGILFSATVKTTDHLFLLDPSTGRTTALTGTSATVRTGWSFTKDFSQCAFISLSADRLPEIGVSPVETFSERLVTDESPGALKGAMLPAREVIRWKSKDGAEIEGILVKPRDFDPKRKYPLLVVIHGGPTGVSYPVAGGTYAYPVDQWVNRGALVLMPNYRGSAGYGASFRALNVRNLGVGDAWDVLSGVDYLVRQGCVDEKKMGCMGWSQGGYISAFLTATSDRFQAISVGAGISDWSLYYVLTDVPDFTRQYLRATPWTDPEIYAKTSPIAQIRKAKTPTLIQHGSNDARVPTPNAYQLYRALKDLKVPSRLIIYNGFGHGVSKPKEQKALLIHNWDWFGHYLWGDPLKKEE